MAPLGETLISEGVVLTSVLHGMFYEYLLALLELYPQCWLKNEFSNEDGNAGVWLAQMVCGKPSVQECEWGELTVEELCHLDDFSIKT